MRRIVKHLYFAVVMGAEMDELGKPPPERQRTEREYPFMILCTNGLVALAQAKCHE
jgi:hypothetical protein